MLTMEDIIIFQNLIFICVSIYNTLGWSHAAVTDLLSSLSDSRRHAAQRNHRFCPLICPDKATKGDRLMAESNTSEVCPVLEMVEPKVFIMSWEVPCFLMNKWKSTHSVQFFFSSHIFPLARRWLQHLAYLSATAVLTMEIAQVRYLTQRAVFHTTLYLQSHNSHGVKWIKVAIYADK